MSAREERISELGFDYGAQPRRQVPACNLCGSTGFVVLTHRDRYGYPASAHACRRCGLVFLNPVMTAEAYKDFYIGVYRPLVSAFHGRVIDAKTIQVEQRDYARERGDFIEPYVSSRGFRSMLDIGGSTGVVARALCERFGLEGTVIDPAPLEIEEARALGLRTITGLAEEYDPRDGRFDVVIMCQTVDHLLDVGRTLGAIHALLEPEGVFFVDIVDFRAAYLRIWSAEAAVKIDHPYYLTSETMEAFLARAGFEVIRTDYAADHLHIGYVCKRGSPAPDGLPSSAAVDRLFEELRFVQNAPRPA